MQYKGTGGWLILGKKLAILRTGCDPASIQHIRLRSLREYRLATDFRKFIRELGVESGTCVGLIPESRIRKQLSRRLVRTSLPPPIIAWCYRARSQGPTRSVREQRSKVVVESDVIRGVRCGVRSVVRRPFRSAPSIVSPLLSSLFSLHATRTPRRVRPLYLIVSATYTAHHTREW